MVALGKMSVALSANEQENKGLRDYIRNIEQQNATLDKDNRALREERDTNMKREKKARFWRSVRDVATYTGAVLVGIGVGSIAK